MALEINKKLKRAADYTYAPKVDGKRKGKVILFEYDRITDHEYRKVGKVSPDEAHRWLHGKESFRDSVVTRPSVDQMIEDIAAQLKHEAQIVMDAALYDEEHLERLWHVAKSGSYPNSTSKSNFKLLRPSW